MSTKYMLIGLMIYKQISILNKNFSNIILNQQKICKINIFQNKIIFMIFVNQTKNSRCKIDHKLYS